MNDELTQLLLGALFSIVAVIVGFSLGEFSRSRTRRIALKDRQEERRTELVISLQDALTRLSRSIFLVAATYEEQLENDQKPDLPLQVFLEHRECMQSVYTLASRLVGPGVNTAGILKTARELERFNSNDSDELLRLRDSAGQGIGQAIETLAWRLRDSDRSGPAPRTKPRKRMPWWSGCAIRLTIFGSIVTMFALAAFTDQLGWFELLGFLGALAFLFALRHMLRRVRR